MNRLRKKSEIFFYVLIRSWRAFEFFDRCVGSVLNQTYKNFKILFVDDHSNYTISQKNYIKNKLANHIVCFNKKRFFSVRNAFIMIHKYAKGDDSVVVNLDGDDWFFDKNTLSYLAETYRRSGCLLTWGECVFWDGAKFSKPSRFLKPYTNTAYPKGVIEENSYRKYPFLPLHPRTWRAWLFKKIKKEDLLREDGSWIKLVEDQAIFYPMLEMASGKFKVIKKPLYVYNIATGQSDLNKNLLEFLKDELIVRKKQPNEPLP